MSKSVTAVLLGVVIALVVFGLVQLDTASDTRYSQSAETRKPALVAGITCVSLGSALLVFAVLLSRKKE